MKSTEVKVSSKNRIYYLYSGIQLLWVFFLELQVDDFTDTTATISWEATQLEKIKFQRYVIQVQDEKIGQLVDTLFLDDYDESSYTLLSLQPITEYSISVGIEAKAPFGQSAWSDSVGIKTLPKPLPRK